MNGDYVVDDGDTSNGCFGDFGGGVDYDGVDDDDYDGEDSHLSWLNQTIFPV